jgi:hypothetical protein
MISVVDILLDSEQFNGHLQTEITRIKYSDALELVKELESRLGKLCDLRIYSDGGASIYALDFWENGENGKHIDRLIVSFNVVYNLP